MLIPRIITALLMLGLVLLLLFYLNFTAFVLVLIAICSLAAWEWANLAGIQARTAQLAYALMSSVLLYILLYWSGNLGVELETIAQPISLFIPVSPHHQAMLTLKLLHTNGVVWAFMLLWVLSYPGSSIIWSKSVVRLILGWLILLPFFVALCALRALDTGVWIILYLLVLVASADVGAYFVGKQFGAKKLLAAVSPGKTWAGFWGGFALALIVAVFAYHYVDDFGLSLLSFVLISAVVIVVSVLGDLSESMLKRFRGIKDSSHLLPGHGGILDRIDSHLAAIPIFCLLYFLLV